MADDRPAEDPTEALARMQRELDDLRSTILVRASRSPTGHIAAWIFPTAPPDTLFLDGSTELRADYPVLWQAVLDRGGVIAGLFGAGNGSTTFTLPDFRGRTLIGVGTLGVDTYSLGQVVGAARVTLSTAELPSHGHTATAATGVTATTSSNTHEHAFDAEHSHSISTDGSHSSHNSGAAPVTASGPNSIANFTQNVPQGAHAHGGGTGGAGSHNHDPVSHSHTISVTAGAPTIGTTGGGGEHENRPPSKAVQWIIYT